MGGSVGCGCFVCAAGSLKFRSAECAHIRWNVELSNRGCLGGRQREDGGHKTCRPSITTMLCSRVLAGCCLVFSARQGVTSKYVFDNVS